MRRYAGKTRLVLGLRIGLGAWCDGHEDTIAGAAFGTALLSGVLWAFTPAAIQERCDRSYGPTAGPLPPAACWNAVHRLKPAPALTP